MKTKKHNLIYFVIFAVTAIAFIFSLILVSGGQLNQKDKSNNEAERAEVSTQYVNQSGFAEWMNNPTTNITLSANVTYRGRISDKDISGILDGNGYTVELTGSGEAWVNDDVGGDRSDPLRGVFSKSISGTVKNVNFVYSGSIILNLDHFMNKHNEHSFVGLITGKVTSSGLMENCTLNFASKYRVQKERPEWTGGSYGAWMFGGLLAGNLMGTMRNCSVNLDAEFDFDVTGRNGNNGIYDRGYIGTVIGVNDGGFLLNTTVNVGTNGSLFVNSEDNEYAAGVLAWNKSATSMVKGILIKNAANFATSIRTDTSGNDYLIVSNYDGGEIWHVYADDTMTSIQCSPGTHNSHTYRLGGGAIETNYAVNCYGDGDLFFKAGDDNRIYYRNESLTDAQCIWAIRNSDRGNAEEVWNTWDFTTRSVGFWKSDARELNMMTFEKGNVKKGAKFGFTKSTLTYGDKKLPTVQMTHNGSVKNAKFDYNLSKPLTPNANGFVNQGVYTINNISTNRIAIANEKTVYIDHVLDATTKSLTINKKTVTMSINQNNNIYQANVSVQGLLGKDVLKFSDYQGINFGSTTAIPKQYLKSDRKLKFTRTLIPTDSNYITDKTYEFVINKLVVSYDSVIMVTPNQANITNGKIEVNTTAHTLTFNDNTVNSISLEAVTDVYGIKYKGFEGTNTISSETTNGKLVANLGINGDVKKITIKGDIDTKRISVQATAGGTATIDYGGANNATPKNVSLGDRFTLRAKVNAGYIFLGWTNTAGEYVSCELNVSFYSKEIVDYKANFERRAADTVKVKISNLYNEGVVEFQTTLKTEAEILAYAKATYINDFNHEAYNVCTGFKVVSSSANGYELLPIYADSGEIILIRINGRREEKTINEAIPLEAGSYVINNVKVVLLEKTVIYAVQGLDIASVAEDYEPDNLQNNIFNGAYNYEEDNDESGYINFTIISKLKLAGEVKLSIRQNGTAKYTAVVKYTQINDNIVQSIVNLPRKVFKDLKGERTITVTVNGVAISGSITLN